MSTHRKVKQVFIRSAGGALLLLTAALTVLPVPDGAGGVFSAHTSSAYAAEALASGCELIDGSAAIVSAPRVSKYDPSLLGANTVEFYGEVTPKSPGTTAYFQWSATSGVYYEDDRTAPFAIEDTGAPQSIVQTINVWNPRRPIYFRLVAENTLGKTESCEQSVTLLPGAVVPDLLQATLAPSGIEEVMHLSAVTFNLGNSNRKLENAFFELEVNGITETISTTGIPQWPNNDPTREVSYYGYTATLPVASLRPGTTYRYRLVGTDSSDFGEPPTNISYRMFSPWKTFDIPSAQAPTINVQISPSLTTAQIAATIYTNQLATTTWRQRGTSTTSFVTSSRQTLRPSILPQVFNSTLGNLKPGTTYYYRQFVQNELGIGGEEWIPFTTQRMVANDTYSTPEDTVLTVPATSGVLANDPGRVTADTLTLSLVNGPTNGEVTLADDGSFVYTPTLNFAGEDTFTYRQRWLGLGYEDTATVTLNVNPVNDAPRLLAGGQAGECPVSGSTTVLYYVTVGDVETSDAAQLQLRVTPQSANAPAATVAPVEGKPELRKISFSPSVLSTVQVHRLQIEVSDGELSRSLPLNLVVGTSSADNTTTNRVLTGSEGVDIVLGFGGNDRLNLLAGDDLGCGGTGADTVYGNDGNDTVSGDEGNDLLYGGAGDDLLRGVGGNDRLYGEAGNDRLEGGAGTTDRFDGGEGTDTTDAQSGESVVNVP